MKPFLIYLIIIFLCGCGAGRQIKPEVKENVNSVEIRFVFKNPTIYTFNNTGGSIYPFINNGVVQLVTLAVESGTEANKSFKKYIDIQPIAQSLAPHDIPGLTKQIYLSEINRIDWIKTKASIIDKGDYPSYDKTTRISNKDAVMFIEIDYYLSENFKKLTINSSTSLYQNRGQSLSAKKVFHMTDDAIYDLEQYLPGLYDKGEIAKKLSEHNAKILKEKIVRGLTKQASNLVKKLNPPKNQQEPTFMEHFLGRKIKKKEYK